MMVIVYMIVGLLALFAGVARLAVGKAHVAKFDYKTGTYPALKKKEEE